LQDGLHNYILLQEKIVKQKTQPHFR
jgi:hypothetical protein